MQQNKSGWPTQLLLRNPGWHISHSMRTLPEYYASVQHTRCRPLQYSLCIHSCLFCCTSNAAGVSAPPKPCTCLYLSCTAYAQGHYLTLDAHSAYACCTHVQSDARHTIEWQLCRRKSFKCWCSNRGFLPRPHMHLVQAGLPTLIVPDRCPQLHHA
jgi:hypothetical protein